MCSLGCCLMFLGISSVLWWYWLRFAPSRGVCLSTTGSLLCSWHHYYMSGIFGTPCIPVVCSLFCTVPHVVSCTTRCPPSADCVLSIKGRRCYNFSEIHFNNICITKWWALRSSFLYLHDFFLTFFSSRVVKFSIFFHVSKLIQTFQTEWIESSTQASIAI